MSELFRLEIVVSEADFPLAQALVGQHAPYGWEEENLPGGKIRLRVHSESRDPIRILEEHFQTMLPAAALTEDIIQEKNWAEAWREFFTPVSAGEFLILPPWLKDDESVDRKDKQVILIEPKSAFGTGHHPSTTLCLEALTCLHRKGKVEAGQRFLDLGAGTGVLGLACVRLGLQGIGLDIDPEAVSNAMENRALNAAGTEFEILAGSIGDVAGRNFQVVIANILANPLKEMAPQVIDVIASDGCLILSGILDHQADDVEAAYAALGPAERLFAPSLADEPGRKEDAAAKQPDHWTCLYWTR